jgi:1,4-alpha-glucan branching enzyme
MALKKRYLKSKPVCKVTFNLGKNEANGAKKAHLSGDFNDWKVRTIPMKAKKDGSFTVTMDLEVGRVYEFRYLLNGKDWITDMDSDGLKPNGLGDDNSVVNV